MECFEIISGVIFLVKMGSTGIYITSKIDIVQEEAIYFADFLFNRF